MHGYLFGMNGRRITSIAAAFFCFCAAAQTPSAIPYSDDRLLDEINTGNADAYPWISADGLRLYYTRNAGGSNALFMSQRALVTDLFGAGVAVLPGYSGDEVGGWLSVDELTLWFSSDQLIKRATRASMASPFGTPVTIAISGAGNYPKSPTLTPDEQELFVFTLAGVQRCVPMGANSYAVTGTLITGASNVGPCKLSHDGLRLYFSADLLGVPYPHRMIRSSLSDPFGDLQYLAGDAFPAPLRHTQCHLTPDELILVGVRADQNMWSANDLFTAEGSDVSGAAEHWLTAPLIAPNPAREEAMLRLPGSWPAADVTVLDAQGRPCSRERVFAGNPVMPLDALAPGLHTVILEHAGQRRVERLMVER